MAENRKVELEDEDQAIHTYIADMATQLSQLADQVGNKALSQHLSQAASTALHPPQKV